MIQLLLRSHPGLLIWVILFGGGAIVCVLVGMLMSRSGASPRPIYWLAGFILLIGGPQFLAHLHLAISAMKSETPRITAMRNLASNSSREKGQESVKLLFGPDADADLVIDARSIFGEALAEAEIARLASFATGETVLLACFRGYSDAERAWVLYLQCTGLNGLGGKGDSQRGYAVTRPVGDRAYALHMGNLLGVWTGPDDATIRRRMYAGGFEVPRRAHLRTAPARSPGIVSGAGTVTDAQGRGNPDAAPDGTMRPARPGRMPTAAISPLGMVVIGGGLAGYLVLLAIYFFKGAAWAGSSPARRGVARGSAAELVSRLEAVNTLDVPFRIERGERDNELIATWRYADAKWVDVARAHGIRGVHRIKLALDESGHTVRATDYAAAYDWTAGRGGASVAWKAMTGIALFHHEHRRVFGLHLDEQGRFKPDLSYAYSFNLLEMKNPLVDAVTQAGWNWRPVVWQVPKRLRWLME